ncbi:MAG: HAMP domain-containing histidine kinase [Ruminococcaceae bacterium]|nr:HAMP domain-containing histidine kinase [Oscillospiraceae bacterium]
MELQLRFKSIARQWIVNVLLVVSLFVIIAEIILFSFIRTVYVERVRAKANEYAQDFSVLSLVPSESFYSAAREYAENFEHKDKIEIEIIDTYGNIFISTSGFLPPDNEQKPDYDAALKSQEGSAYVETKTEHGEPVLCGTNLLTDYGAGSNGAVRWRVSLEEMNSTVSTLRIIFVATGLLMIGVTALSGIYFTKSIVKPIREVSAAARKIAGGDFETKIEMRNNDEIGELCDSINYMATELRRAEDMKNDFISSVSHELRTPLTAIRGWGETAKMSLGTDSAIVEKGLDVVLSESERLSGLVEELLDFSRMQTGRLSVTMSPIGISDLLGEVCDMYTEFAHQHSIALEYARPKEDSIIMGDKNRLKQVFINVIDNAVKYTEAGGQVLVEQTEDDGCVRITVRDTGVGIPAQDIDRVKEKFFKSNKTVRGSGIGLAVADEIVKQHRGLIFIESTEGVGTTVTVALPLYEQPEENGESNEQM